MDRHGATTHVFAYGSNLDERRMAARVPSARILGRAVLQGHELRFHKQGSDDGTGKANAYRTDEPGTAVHGVVYAMDERELIDLDVHETGYERHSKPFVIEGRDEITTVEAWVYLALPEVIDDSLVPTQWYLGHVMAGARAQGLPGELLAWLQAHPTAG